MFLHCEKGVIDEMGRKLMTFDDLYEFFSHQDHDVSFSAKDNDSHIVIQAPGEFVFSEAADDDSLMKVHLKSCHIGDNRNHSRISEATMKEAIPSFANKPILGYLHEVDGQMEFGGHNFHVDENHEIVYDEAPVGCIPESNNAELVYDEGHNKTYLEVDGYIYKEYSKAAEVLERENTCKVSVEIDVDDLSYNAKDKILQINAFRFMGVTILGKTADGTPIEEGMEGSNIMIADFSSQNNSLIKGIEPPEDGNVLLNNNKNSTEGGKTQVGTEEKKVMEEVTESQEETPEVDNTCSYGIIVNGKTFELSLSDKLRELSELVNDQYGAADEDYYFVDAYEKYLVMRGADHGKVYRQSYTEEDGVFTLVGDRVEVHAVYLTDEEESQLKGFESKYNEAKDELDKVNATLAKYEAEPDKMDILNSEDYSVISDTDEFKALMKDHFDLSVDEVTAKANEILLNFAKHFRAKDDNINSKVKPMPQINKRKCKKYGNIFKD